MSRLACTEDYFIMRGRTPGINEAKQTPQKHFKSNGSAQTSRDFSTKGIVSRARGCHLLGSGILKIPPAERIGDPWIPGLAPAGPTPFPQVVILRALDEYF